jgi:hypothetical protein
MKLSIKWQTRAAVGLPAGGAERTRCDFPLPVKPLLASIDQQRLRGIHNAMPVRLPNMRNTPMSIAGYGSIANACKI